MNYFVVSHREFHEVQLKPQQRRLDFDTIKYHQLFDVDVSCNQFASERAVITQIQ